MPEPRTTSILDGRSAMTIPPIFRQRVPLVVSCVLLGIGALVVWRSRAYVTTNTIAESTRFSVIETRLRPFVQIASAASHSCARDVDGHVWCWGLNRHGETGAQQLPDARCPTVDRCGAPVRIEGNFVAIDLATALFRSCAVDESGALHCWGISPFWGRRAITEPLSHGGVVAGLPPLASVCLGEDHGCGVTTSGEVACWGSDDFGQLGQGRIANTWNATVPLGGEKVASVSCGGWHSCALTRSGQVACWGRADDAQIGSTLPADQCETPFGRRACQRTPRWVEGLEPTKSVALGSRHSCALGKDGLVRCWGSNVAAQIGTAVATTCIADGAIPYKRQAHSACATAPTLVPGVVEAKSIAAGGSGTCAIIATKTTTNEEKSPVVCWGGEWSAGEDARGCMFIDQREAFCGGEFEVSPRNLSGLGAASPVALSVGARHACFVDSTKVSRCYGNNTWSQAGEKTGAPLEKGRRARTTESDSSPARLPSSETPGVWTQARGLSCSVDTQVCAATPSPLAPCTDSRRFEPPSPETTLPGQRVHIRGSLEIAAPDCQAVFVATCGGLCTAQLQLVHGVFSIRLGTTSEPSTYVCSGDESQLCCDAPQPGTSVGVAGTIVQDGNHLAITTPELCALKEP